MRLSSRKPQSGQEQGHLMTEQNLFQEVQEDLERQKLEALWKKYGFWIIVASLGIVISTASATAYRSWKENNNAKLTSALLSAEHASANVSDNIAALQKYAEENTEETHALFALFRAGALALDRNETTEAIKYFEKAAQNTDANPVFSQLGVLLSVLAQLDSGSPAELALRLQPLTLKGSPWRFSAQEALAYLALREGDITKAKQLFSSLAQDSLAPKSISSRATDILRTLN